MSGGATAVLVQASGLVLAPLLVGTIQNAKARLQGRRGAGPLQPYRELRRLWSRSVVDPEGTGIVYRLAPSVVAATLACAVLVTPVAGWSSGWLGSDALVLVGLLAAARLAATSVAWDPGMGFSLMGAARDLMFSVFNEPLLLMALLLVALETGSTDLALVASTGSDPDVLARPAHWASAVAFALVVLVETGRQPIDNPDTHLELTMVHEGPLLEHAGRDLAMLQWGAAARHWVVLVLAAGMFVPTPSDPALRILATAGTLGALCLLLALVETSFAKLRILRVPALLGTGLAACMLGLAAAITAGAG